MFLELRASTVIFRLGSGSGGFGPTAVKDCTSHGQIVMPKCWQHHIVNHLSIMRKPDLCQKRRLAGPGMFTCLPYATWRGIWNYASILCVKQSSTISTPMFTFTIFIRYKTIMSTIFIRCTFLKKASFPSPLPEQNPNDNFILWKPSFPTTQQEHAAAQISMAVKMGEAFWYATWW